MSESPRHRLDADIDRVAARMVAVPDDASLLLRTLARLPERHLTPWFMALPVQMAAAAAVLLVTFFFARPAQELATHEGMQAVVTAPGNTALPDARTPELAVAAATVGTPGSRIPAPAAAPVARQAPSRPAALDRPDHEHSLAPVDAIDALELVGIAPPAMELHATPAPAALVVPEITFDTKGDS